MGNTKNKYHSLLSQLHLGSSCLHYGLEIFEGLKAYLTAEGRTVLFRPIENAKRMRRSAERLALPTFDPEDLVELIKRAVWNDRDYIPKGADMSLYIRPTLIALDERLGVKPPEKALLYILLSPTGLYFHEASPKLFATSKWSRACKGGVGDCKCGGNYAASIMPQCYAAKKGCSQVLWLTPDDDKHVTEVGAMNFMMAFRKPDGHIKIITAPIDGIILPGITRMSLLEIMREHPSFKGYEIEEKYISIDELVRGIETGECIECFGCGTAAIVTATGSIVYEDDEYKLPESHEIAHMLHDRLCDIQYGRASYSDWTVEVRY
eukprot:gnl/Chilomastix_caulleri/1498.p1 GENE.gnl/Chilomastix_caulleri/1498~~gnl/Chilomastix_caulleri/1498.p1  ORF type:complete len:321 (+),score=114.24 gnl/Chilomastix_caulleri/1498:308-1270(+)